MIQNHRRVFATVICLFVFLLFSAFPIFIFAQESERSGDPSPIEKPVPTQEAFVKGKALFGKQCAVCHGPQGAGDGPAAYLLYPKPRDFTRNEFRLISTTQMKATDEDLFETITRGMPGSSMPSWEHLSDQDRWALVYYVRYLAEYQNDVKRGEIFPEVKGVSWKTIEKMLATAVDPKIVIQVPNEPAVNPESIERGKELFVKACASCHGPEGKGDGQQMMKDSLGFPTKPRDLTSGIFKGESNSSALYDRIVAGLPGSPMPSYARALKDDQIWDLIHYVQTLPQPEAEERSRVHRVKIVALRTKEKLDLNPLAPYWETARPSFVSLTPLWWRNTRVEGVDVSVLCSDEDIEILLSWKDATKDISTLDPQSFSDGAAVQFSAEKDPPFFGMGSAQSPVSIWHWKASWQEDMKEWKDVEMQYPNTATDWYEAQKNYQYGSSFETKDSKTKFHDPHFITGWGAGNPLSNPAPEVAAEEARAQGAGTLTTMRPQLEKVDAKGVWSDGTWQVVFKRKLETQEKERLQFEPGVSFSFAFAIWDGSEKDRNGQKMISIWNDLEI
ncbi:MAG: c-type cytochrome [Chlamydiae bacterium]|nr:c-type cytochrome [Chlamydiota bacterium]